MKTTSLVRECVRELGTLLDLQNCLSGIKGGDAARPVVLMEMILIRLVVEENK